MDVDAIRMMVRGCGYLFLIGFAVGCIKKILMPGHINHD